MSTALSGFRQRGLTLLEMLVTLVIVSMVVSIFWQMMGQAARVERLLEGAQLRSLAVSVRAEWIRAALAAMLPGRAGSAELFQGESRSLQGLSTETPGYPGGGLTELRLSFDFDRERGATRLQLFTPEIGSDGAARDMTVLLSWPGNTGRFRYLDRSGKWHDRWPPATLAVVPALPAAVLVETGLREVGLIISTPQASDLPLPTRSQIEGDR